MPQTLRVSFGDEPVNADGMRVVRCTFIKGDSPLTISWFFNGVEITLDS
jgi:hypothetical protein